MSTTPPQTTIRYTLPKGVRPNAGLESLGMAIDASGDPVTVTWQGSLRDTLPSKLASAITRYVDLEGHTLRRTVWPTGDLETPLVAQLDTLFGRRHERHLAIGFFLTGTGWAVCVVASPEGAKQISASYLEDALGGLVALALGALQQGEGRCRFAEEPGEFRWVFAENRLRILSFDDVWSNEPDAHGEELFGLSITAEALGRAVLACASAVERRYGLRTYLELWVEFPFPTDGVQRLRETLGGQARLQVGSAEGA